MMELLLLGFCLLAALVVIVGVLRKAARMITVAVVGFVVFSAVFFFRDWLVGG